MLWTLLTATSSLALLISAVLSAKQANAGSGGYALAVGIGVLLGIYNAVALDKVGAMVASRVGLNSQSPPERGLQILYVAAALWIAVAAFFGDWVASAAIGLLA